jgi:hypothetical protein
VEALEPRQRQPEPNTALKLLTPDELRRALAERGEILPNGEVRHPDHLEAAEELLDRARRALRGPDRITLEVFSVATTF